MTYSRNEYSYLINFFSCIIHSQFIGSVRCNLKLGRSEYSIESPILMKNQSPSTQQNVLSVIFGHSILENQLEGVYNSLLNLFRVNKKILAHVQVFSLLTLNISQQKISELPTYSEPSQTSKMQLLVNIVNVFQVNNPCGNGLVSDSYG